MREWSYISTIHDLDTGWMWVVSFKPQSFYLWGKSSQYELHDICGRDHKKKL
jgi:hypothetical protein